AERLRAFSETRCGSLRRAPAASPGKAAGDGRSAPAAPSPQHEAKRAHARDEQQGWALVKEGRLDEALALAAGLVREAPGFAPAGRLLAQVETLLLFRD